MLRADSLAETLMLGRIEDRGEEGNRGWDGWTASLVKRAWIWASSRRRRRTGKPAALQSMGSWRVRHNLATGQQNRYEPGIILRGLYNNIVYLQQPYEIDMIIAPCFRNLWWDEIYRRSHSYEVVEQARMIWVTWLTPNSMEGITAAPTGDFPKGHFFGYLNSIYQFSHPSSQGASHSLSGHCGQLYCRNPIREWI